jgi:hypothetical protein
MAAEFVKNIYVKKGKYGIKVSFKADAFIEELKAKKDKEGWVRVEIKETRAGDKMYAQYDTWQPNASGQSDAPAKSSYSAPKPKPSAPKVEDDLPF